MRRLAAVLATAVCAVLCAVGLAGPANAQESAQQDWYRIENLGSHKCFDNFAWTSTVYQFGCNAQANQLWTWYQVPGRPNAWYIEAPQLYGCIETTASGNGARLVLAGCRSGRTQSMWIWVPVSGGWYAIKNVASGRCVDVPNGTTADVPLVQYDCNYGRSQQWKGELRVSG